MKTCLVAIAVWLMAVHPHARGCSCLAPEPPLKALAHADAVFSGEVIDITPHLQNLTDEQIATGVEGFKITVRVTKSWKGNVKGTITVVTGSGFGDCGYEFTEEPYLFYCWKNEKGELRASICSRIAPLKATGEQTMELDGKLPVLTTPPQDPVLEMKGRINDAGYDGYVFTLQNRVHERIFYYSYKSPVAVIQVLQAGKWTDYPPAMFPREAPLSPTAASDELAKWRQYYSELDTKELATFQDRSRSVTIFVGTAVNGMTWRAGLQYLTEREIDAGKKIQESSHCIWSQPIEPDAPVKQVSFKEMGGGYIPAPFGSKSPATPQP